MIMIVSQAGALAWGALAVIAIVLSLSLPIVLLFVGLAILSQVIAWGAVSAAARPKR